MPKTSHLWSAGEPEIGSVMDTLRVETIGSIPAKKESIQTRFPFDGFGLVLRGTGFYRIDNGPVRILRAPAIFYIWPGPVFHYGPEPGTSWEERYLCFSGPRVRDWLRWQWLSRPDRPQTVADPDTLAQLHRDISRAFPPFSESPVDQAKIEIEQLVHEVYRQRISPSSKQDKLAVLIRRWIKEPERVGDMREAARELGMSYSGFRAHFSSRTGLAPHQFVLRLRVDQACLRLAKTNDLIKTVALDSGFSFVASFNRAFRQVKGISPGEYRRRMSLLTRSTTSEP